MNAAYISIEHNRLDVGRGDIMEKTKEGSKRELCEQVLIAIANFACFQLHRIKLFLLPNIAISRNRRHGADMGKLHLDDRFFGVFVKIDLKFCAISTGKIKVAKDFPQNEFGCADISLLIGLLLPLICLQIFWSFLLILSKAC